MFNLFNGLLLIGLCSRLIVAGSLGGNGGGGGHHGKGIGYSIFTKHEIPIHHHHEWKSHEGFMGGEGGFAGQSGDAGSEGGHYHHHEDFHQYPKYKYEYGVKDLKTGDIKDQWEMRDGDYVKGAYSLKEADGTTRVVDYTADKHHGFNAVVNSIGHPSIGHEGLSSGGWGDKHHGYDHHSHGTSYAGVKFF